MENRIKEIRKSAGLTQAEFAEVIGSSKNTVTSYEGGYRKPPNTVVRAICKEFSISEDWLLTGEGEMHAPLTREAEIAQVAANLFKSRKEYPYIVDVVKLLQKMDKNQWDVLFNVARQLSEIDDKYNKKGAE